MKWRFNFMNKILLIMLILTGSLFVESKETYNTELEEIISNYIRQNPSELRKLAKNPNNFFDPKMVQVCGTLAFLEPINFCINEIKNKQCLDLVEAKSCATQFKNASSQGPQLVSNCLKTIEFKPMNRPIMPSPSDFAELLKITDQSILLLQETPCDEALTNLKVINEKIKRLPKFSIPGLDDINTTISEAIVFMEDNNNPQRCQSSGHPLHEIRSYLLSIKQNGWF